MKEKLFNSLKTEYANLGFSDKTISGIAESLAATGIVTDENLDDIIKGQKPLMISLQGEVDRRVTTATEKVRNEIKTETTDNGGGDVTEPKQSASPLNVKALVDQAVAEKVAPLQERLQQYENKEAAQARQNLIAAKAKELGIDSKGLQFLLIPDDLDENGIQEHLAAYKQYEVDRGLPTRSPFPQSDGKVTKEEADRIAEGMSI